MIPMTEMPMRRRCSANTERGVRCKMWAESGDKCRYHIGGEITAAVHAKNREGTRRFWAAYRVAKAIAAVASRGDKITNVT
jgi:hypothetical protein